MDQNQFSTGATSPNYKHSRLETAHLPGKQRRHAELKRQAERPVWSEGIHYEAGSGAVGGNATETEARFQLMQEHKERTNKIAKKMKEDERKKEAKRQEDMECEQKKALARLKSEKLKNEAEKRKPSPEELRELRLAHLSKSK